MYPGNPKAYRARYAFPMWSAPVRDFLFTSSAFIEVVGENRSPDPLIDFGNAAILPGLVNAHTHLELSGFEQPLGDPTLGFPAWIREVIAWRRAQNGTPQELAAQRHRAIAKGMAEVESVGTTGVWDIASPGWRDLYPTNNRLGRGTMVYEEILGLSTARADELFRHAESAFSNEQFRSHQLDLPPADRNFKQMAEEAEQWRLSRPVRPFGFSPHAPYTVGIELLARLAKLSSERQFPLAMHLAESREELELMRSHSGAFHTLLCDLDAWDSGAIPRGVAPLDYLKVLAKSHSAVVIHGNYLNDDELDFIAAHPQLTIVYCPRTHAYFGHSRYPLPEMLQRGISVMLGTDSRASNPDLNIWNELRYVADNYPELPLHTIVKLAVPYSERYPRLTERSSANFIVVDLPDEECDDPYELLLDPRARFREAYYQGMPVNSS